MAPEVLDRYYSKECDIWSIGVTIYFFYSLNHPFKGSNLKELIQRIRNGKFIFKSLPEFPGLWKSSSPEMRDLIAKMLVVNP
jgi:serine/threonine protein kinase